MIKDLRSLDLEELKDLMINFGKKSFRAEQIFSWIHEKGIVNYAEMLNLSKAFRERLAKETKICKLELAKKQVSKDGTIKYLFQLEDNNYIECVLMKYRGTKSKVRNTLCISSQVGCAMGCGFCATGKGGFVRNLTVAEILAQVYFVNNIEKKFTDNFKVNNVVFMGMGEPLLNFENVLKAISLLNNEQGQNISIRRITVSTCGIVPKIIELAEKKLDIVLAISLHAPDDKLRSQIMPINNRYSLKQLKKACQFYNNATDNRISFEYALVENFNDQQEHVIILADFLKGLKCHVNLIPVNPVDKSYVRPKKENIIAFLEQLKKQGINASIREERGSDIDGACGQLGKNFIAQDLSCD